MVVYFFVSLAAMLIGYLMGVYDAKKYIKIAFKKGVELGKEMGRAEVSYLRSEQ